MNKLIKEQLDKLKDLLPEYDDDTLELFIPKASGIAEFSVGDTLCIKIADYVLNPYEGFTLQDNWNNGTVPPDHIMYVQIIKITGSMIRVSGRGENKQFWEGWLPKKSITILERY